MLFNITSSIDLSIDVYRLVFASSPCVIEDAGSRVITDVYVMNDQRMHGTRHARPRPRMRDEMLPCDECK